jgi:hypothetical protein
MADEIAVSKKPGWKTSEFWLSTAAMLTSQLYAAGVIGDASTVGKVVAAVASVLTALGYTVLRAKAKA